MSQKSGLLAHPKGLYVLFFTEMWERFSYYGMRAIFTLYMAKALLFDKEVTSSLYGDYTGLVYLTPLLGGYIADRYWGNRQSILVGGILMAIGQFLMFTSGMMYQDVEMAKLIMFTGLGFLIFGNGFFKPNISTMVGQLYPQGDKRVDSAFTIFYMGINLGAFIAPIVCGTVGDTGNPADFKWGFLAAGIGMIISTVSFYFLKDRYIIAPDGSPVGNKPIKIEKTAVSAKNSMSTQQMAFWAGVFVVLYIIFKGALDLGLIGSLIYTACLVAPAIIITDKSLDKSERDRVWVIIIMAFFVIFFWSAFEQAGVSLTFFAEEQTDRHISLFDWTIPASYFQSINAVAIVIFAPLFAFLWTTLGNRNVEPPSLVKQALGLLLLALGYVFIAYQVNGLDPKTKVSMLILVTLYVIHTFGELCLSPIGLSMVAKLSPIRFASLLMGVWFLSTATANKFAGDLGALYPQEVKLVTTADATKFGLSDITAQADGVVIADENYLRNINKKAAPTTWKVVLSTDDDAQPAVLPFSVKFTQNLFGTKEKAVEDTLYRVEQIAATAPVDATVPEYKLKQVINANSPAHDLHMSSDGKKLYVLKAKKLEVWDLNPEKPSFAGIQINNLYDFFLIFVVLSGAASVLLFILARPLGRMMHGVK